MSLEIKKIARANILALQPYTSARSLTTQGRIFLDANEASIDVGAFNRYPLPQPPELTAALARIYNVSSKQICVGRGADEAIDLLVRASCDPGMDSIVICPPTYGMYEIAAAIQGAKCLQVPLLPNGDSFELDLDKIVDALQTKPKLLFICRPNNPTGESVDLSEIRLLARECGSHTLLVIDEAYIEFTELDSASTLIDEFDNIVVLRTLSKAWALAGVRVGAAIASPQVIDLLHKVRAPYPLSTMAVKVAIEALSDPGLEQMRQRVSSLLKLREQLVSELKQQDTVTQLFDSQANFILVKVAGSSDLKSRCKASGIILRDRSTDPGLADCLRITVGNQAENAALLAVWRAWEKERYA